MGRGLTGLCAPSRAVPSCSVSLQFVTCEVEITELVLLGKGRWVRAVDTGVCHICQGNCRPLWVVTSLGFLQASGHLCDDINMESVHVSERTPGDRHCELSDGRRLRNPLNSPFCF